MVFQENLVIGFFATLCGIGVGLVFSQFILSLSKFLLNNHLNLYFPLKAILFTACSFLLLFFLISVFISFSLPKFTLQELLKSDQYGKGEIKLASWKAICGVLLIAIGYVISLNASGRLVFNVMFPVVILVVVGTKWFFDQFTLFFIKKYQSQKQLFWRKTNLLVFSDLGFRMKDNARAFFLVTIMATAGIASIASLYNFKQQLLRDDDAIYEFSYEGTEADIAAFTTEFEKALADYQVQAESMIFDYLNHDEYMIMAESHYNQLANFLLHDAVNVKDQSLVIAERGGDATEMIGDKVDLNPFTIEVFDVISSNVISFSKPTLIVADEVYESLTDSLTPNSIKIWEPIEASEEQIVAVGEKFASNLSFYSKTTLKLQIFGLYTPVLFVGFFIGIVFYVAASSFLYFRLFSEAEVDIEKFRMVNKIGLTRKELKKMIALQVGILFFTPIVVALAHGIVALTAMNQMFNRHLQLIDIQVLGIFLLIQVIYYLICCFFYERKIAKAVFS